MGQFLRKALTEDLQKSWQEDKDHRLGRIIPLEAKRSENAKNSAKGGVQSSAEVDASARSNSAPELLQAPIPFRRGRKLGQKPECIVSQPRQVIGDSLPASFSASTNKVCPSCKGAGYRRIDVPFGHPQFGKIEKCTCSLEHEHLEKCRKLREVSQMEVYQNKTFASFNFALPGIADVFKQCWKYAQELGSDGWLILYGPGGTGKTHLAAAVANTCLERGIGVLFMRVPDLLDYLREAYAPTSTVSYDSRMALLREVDVLVLDDLGVQQSTPWAKEKLFQLIDYRYARANLRNPTTKRRYGATVVTTNHLGLVDERIRSRLSDASLVEKVSLEEVQDYRLRDQQ